MNIRKRSDHIHMRDSFRALIKKNEIFLLFKEIQSGAVAKSFIYMRKGFLIFEEMRKYLVIYVEAVIHI